MSIDQLLSVSTPFAVDRLWHRPAAGGSGRAVALLPDCDLAANRPGPSVRERAREQRGGMPLRSFVSRLTCRESSAFRLARLGQDWRVLHAVPVGEDGDVIDQVVIGPAGLFTVNVKHHPDASVWIAREAVRINGTNVPYVRNSRYQARRVSRLLTDAAGFDVRVQGIVAFVGAQRALNVREQPEDVTVLRRESVPAHLRNAPVVLGPDMIEQVYAVARHLATWRPYTVGWQEFSSS